MMPILTIGKGLIIISASSEHDIIYFGISRTRCRCGVVAMIHASPHLKSEQRPRMQYGQNEVHLYDA